MLNAYWEPLTFELPPATVGRAWRRCIDTARASPDDIQPWPAAATVTSATCTVQPRSIVVVAQRLEPEEGA
jgi:glycogen operon protein